uniref:Nucleotide-diphospho-sugar transferase domain-containing protein n=1 Tax=viral metagenome TaxID=1070528 RepID=A0A6C0I0Y4_9ZZZZ
MSAIVYIHKGDSFYLNYIFKITRNSNPMQRIIFIGDDENKKYSDIFNLEFYYINDFSISEFNYKHYSVNPEPYEKFCYDRWIILNNFLKQTQIEIDNIIYSDSDNAFFMNIDELLKSNEITYYNVLYLGNSMIVCPNVFIAKKNVFEIISNGIIEFFNQDNKIIEEIIETKKWYYNDDINHFSDMFILKYILDNKPNIYKANICYINIYDKPLIKFNNFTLDCNYNNIKDKIILKDKLPFIEDKQLFNIHFAGSSKKEIIHFMEFCNNYV